MEKIEILVLLKGAHAEIEATGRSEGVYFGNDKDISSKLITAIEELESELTPSAVKMTEYERGFMDAIKCATAVCKVEEKKLLWQEGETLPQGNPRLLQMASVANCCAAYIDRIVSPNAESSGAPKS